ncbi:MAG TPA: hypothetical protein VG674_33335 [Amycolatopsis sp.]|nr:hypothetical protein [Amycolatopsis sp.]
MSFFDVIGDGAKWVGDRIKDGEHWVEKAWHGNVGTQAVPAPELVQKILDSKGASGWHEGAGKATELASDHDSISSDVRQLSTGLESVWTGEGADLAQQRIRMFSDATTVASQTYTTNGENLTGLAHGFDEMRAALRPMPERPPHKGVIDVATPWDTDTEDKIKQYNQLAQQNLDRYNGYAQQAKSSTQALKTDYGSLTGFDGTVTITEQGKVTRKKQTREHETRTTEQTNTTNTEQTNTERTNTERTNTDDHDPTDPRSTVDPRHTTTPPETPLRTTPPPYTPPPTDRPIMPPEHPPTLDPPSDDSHDPGRSQDDTTDTSSYVPPSVGDQVYSPTSGLTGPGAGGSSGGSGSGGYFGGAGGIGGFGGIGGGTGAGAGSGGSRFGSGAGTGSGENGRGPLAARGTTGTAGAKGAPGMGAAGGRGAKGEEDAEHQRKYGIEDDSAFTLLDDDEGRILDPRTGLPPTPPTLGA